MQLAHPRPALLPAPDALIGRENVDKLLDIEFFAHHDTGGVVNEHVPVALPFAEALLDPEAARLGAAMDGGLAGNCGNGVSPSR